MARFKIYLEYEGTRYSGWQAQKNARTIQGSLLNVADEIFKGERSELYGSGRTDSGVHALCQVAHLDVRTMLAPEIIRMKFNDKLPHDINILEIEKAKSNFHARYDAVSRSYLYQVSRRRTAFAKNFVWWVKDDLDVNKMKSASELLKGMHDFASFADEDKEEKSTKVLLTGIELKECGENILIRITGSHFLWKMVRRIVGVLVETGRGKMTQKEILSFLTTKTNKPAQYTAPPSGLFLESVLYNGETQKRDLIPIFTL